MRRSIQISPFYAAIAAFLLATTGCTVFRPTTTAGAGDYEMADPAALRSTSHSLESYSKVAEARQSNSVVLEIEGTDPIRVLPLPANGQSVFVSTLLKQTEVAGKLGAIDVELMRATDHSVDGLKMAIHMNADRTNVRPETDYALQPGDRIRVRKFKNDAVRSFLKMAGLNLK